MVELSPKCLSAESVVPGSPNSPQNISEHSLAPFDILASDFGTTLPPSSPPAAPTTETTTTPLPNALSQISCSYSNLNESLELEFQVDSPVIIKQGESDFTAVRNDGGCDEDSSLASEQPPQPSPWEHTSVINDDDVGGGGGLKEPSSSREGQSLDRAMSESSPGANPGSISKNSLIRHLDSVLEHKHRALFEKAVKDKDAPNYSRSKKS